MSIWISGAIMLGSAAVGAYSSNKSADAIEKGSRRASNLEAQMFEQIRSDQGPFREVGYQSLNAYAQAMGLPGFDVGSAGGPAGQGHPLYGDGNVPLTAEGVNQAFQDFFGRSASQKDMDWYTSRGPREGGKAGLAPFGWATGGDPLGLSGSKGKRRAYTFNELIGEFMGSDEYQDKLNSGQIEAWNDERRNAIFNPPSNVVANQQPYGGFQKSPGYQFRMDEGQKGINRALASRGLLNSGARGKALTRFNQDYASNEFQNYLNNMGNLAGIGQVATNQTSGYGSAAANRMASNELRGADARASGYMGTANTINNGINNWLMMRALR